MDSLDFLILGTFSFGALLRFLLRKKSIKLPPEGGKPELAPPLNSALLLDQPEDILIPHQVVFPPALFIGREKILSEVEETLDKGILVISPAMGQSGIGCTSLIRMIALQLAHKYPDGQVYIDLRGGETNPLNAGHIAIELAKAWFPYHHLVNPDPQATFQGIMENRRILVILENASDRDQLLSFRPPAGCGLIVTARFPLDIPGASQLELQPLSHEESASFLKQLAPERVNDEQALAIASYCAGIPLAVYLVGKTLVARHRLTPELCVKRLSDSIHALQESPVEASCRLAYDLLEDRLQRFWPELAVFPDSFDLQAASALWGCSPEETLVFLNRLKECGLLEIETTWSGLPVSEPQKVEPKRPTEKSRFRLHELCRSFAASRIPEAEQEVVALRFASHYARRVLAMGERLLHSPGKITQILDEITPETIHIQVAQSWCASHSGKEDADRICSNFAIGMRWLFNYAFLPTTAVFWIDSALAASRNLQDTHAEVIHLTSLLEAYVSVGDAQRVLDVGVIALPLAQKVQDQLAEGIILLHLGEACLLLSDYPKAVRYLNKSLRIFNETGYFSGKARVLVKLATLQKIEQSLETLKAAFALAHQSHHGIIECSVQWLIANVYANLGKRKEALLVFQDLAKKVPILGLQIDRVDVIYRIGTEYLEIGAPHLARMCFQRSADLYRRVGNLRGLAWSFNRMGLCSLSQADFVDAQKNFSIANDIFQSQSDPSGELNTLWGLGTSYLGLYQPTQAIFILKQLLDKSRLANDRNLEYLALWQLAEAYLAFRDFEKAIDCFNKSLEVADILKNSQVRILALLGMSRTYREEGKPSQALEYCEAAKKSLKEPPDPLEQALIEHATALVYDSMGDKRQAVEHARQAQSLYQQKGDPRSEQLAGLIASWKNRRGLAAWIERLKRSWKS